MGTMRVHVRVSVGRIPPPLTVSPTRTDLARVSAGSCSWCVMPTPASQPASKAMMEAFHKECLRFGALRHFTHFTCHLRGREELMVIVHARQASSTSLLRSRDSLGGSSAASLAAVAAAPEVLARAAAAPPSPGGAKDVGLASHGDVVYLVGGYSRYNWPYVWLRAGGGADAQNAGGERDVPLELRTTAAWGEGKVRIWHIVHELVQRSFAVPPRSPFAVDRAALLRLSPVQRALASAALAAFFKEALLSTWPSPDVKGTAASGAAGNGASQADPLTTLSRSGSSGSFPGFQATAPPKAPSLGARRSLMTEPLHVAKDAATDEGAECAPPWLEAGRAHAEEELVWCLETHFDCAHAIVRHV